MTIHDKLTSDDLKEDLISALVCCDDTRLTSKA